MRMPWTRFATGPLLLTLLTACDLVGPKSFRLVFQLIETNGSEQADPRIADVVEQLDDSLRFEGYSLASEISVPLAALGREPGDEGDGPRVVYTLKEGGVKLEIGRLGEDRSLHIRIDKGPETVVEATVGMRLDQTLVLGSVPQTDDKVLLFVVRMVEA